MTLFIRCRRTSVPGALPPQVEVAVLEAEVFVRRLLVGELGDGKRQRRRGIQDPQRLHFEFDLAGGDIGPLLAGEPFADDTGDGNDVFPAQFLRGGEKLLVRILSHHLRQPVPVSQIDEHLVREGAGNQHPPGEGDGLPDVGFAEVAAGVGPLPIRHGYPLRGRLSPNGHYTDGVVGPGFGAGRAASRRSMTNGPKGRIEASAHQPTQRRVRRFLPKA